MKKATIFIVIFVSVIIGLNLPSFAQDQHVIDSLQNLLKTNIEDTTRVNMLLSLADKYSYENPDTALLFATQAKKIAEKIKDSKRIAKALREMGWDYFVLGNYYQALKQYFHALEINESLNNKKGIAATLGNIGLVYKEQGEYPKALEFYFRSLQIKKEIKNIVGISNTLGNIGVVYKNQRDYTKALEYYFKALKMNKELGKKNYVAANLGNIAHTYAKEGRHVEALQYYFKALKLMEELENKQMIAMAFGNIGIVYNDQGDSALATGDIDIAIGNKYPKALEYYFKALEMDKELGNKSGVARHLGNTGSLYTSMMKSATSPAEAAAMAALAEDNLLQALELVKEMEILEGYYHIHQLLSELYSRTNNYRQAYEHFKQYNIAKDSLFNEEKSKEIGKLEAKHEFETAEAERKRLEIEALRLEVEIKQRSDNLQYSGILIFIVLLFAGVFFIGRFSIPIKLAEGMIFFSFLFSCFLSLPWYCWIPTSSNTAQERRLLNWGLTLCWRG